MCPSSKTLTWRGRVKPKRSVKARWGRFYLEEVGEIDEHIVASFFLSTRDVETDCYYVETFAPFRELVFYREGVQTRRGEGDDVGESQIRGDTLDLAIR